MSDDPLPDAGPVAPATPRADLAVGGFVTFLGALTLYGAYAVPASPLYAQVGATAIPIVVGVFLVVIGVLLSLVGLRGGWSHGLEELIDAPPVNWRSLAIIFAALLVQLALIEWLGFVIAATIQYVLVCAAFGSRHPLRDLLIGAVVCLAAYLGFDRLLGVNIGAGILEGII
ncbi:tripartite tricarboxylate transporter TctB family protein [Roseomonas sp. CCTCC AB2023176]|uniref:tripartite tricarboxylate transporter TctB family protein n=1 Tax=Roseomonas sp. CCTCC AB2023176 TaxID=3342640 RepID=UPI0035D8BB54